MNIQAAMPGCGFQQSCRRSPVVITPSNQKVACTAREIAVPFLSFLARRMGTRRLMIATLVIWIAHAADIRKET